MATHFGILAWRILWTGEPGGLRSMGHESDRTERLTHTSRTRSQGHLRQEEQSEQNHKDVL